MIKKTLGTLLIGLGLTNICFGYGLQVFDLGLEENINDNPTQNNYFELQNNANFLLNGQYKLLQTYSKTTAGGNTINYARLRNIFWNEDGLYTIVSNGAKNNSNVQTTTILQGQIFQYCKTTYGTTENDICNSYYVGTQVYGINTFLENTDYANPDILLYKDNNQTFYMCFGYENLNENICFNLDGGTCNDYCNTSCNITPYQQYGVSNNCNSNNFTYNPLASELGTNTDQISQFITNSKFGGGNNNGTGIQQIRTGQNYYCPTFKQLLSTYPTNYNTGLCYNGTLKYENGQLTTVQKQDMFTVFTDYEEYQQYVYLYNNYCTGPATQTACENAFNGEREKYSIISNAYNKNVDDKKIWQYCDMALNYDPNTTTCTAGTGTLEDIGQAPTPENLQELIEQLTNIGNIQTPITGNILNNLLEDGQTREDISPRNILGNLDQIKDKLSNLFEERTGTTGIIPDYIMWLILVSLLLTVLLKK